jgi:hypothetical protein
MSDLVRIAVVAEGPTDEIVIEAVAAALLPRREIVVTQLQPSASEAFPTLGLGWNGVYMWCRQVRNQSGSASENVLFDNHDMLIVHLDADVAGQTYGEGHIDDDTADLPCEQRCPPSSATTDALRVVLLRWLGEARWPDRIVPCIPSRSTETWVLVALHPDDDLISSDRLECDDSTAARLAGKPSSGKLVRKKKGRYRKDVSQYRLRMAEIATAWPRVRTACTEAQRYSEEFSTAASQVLPGA